MNGPTLIKQYNEGCCPCCNTPLRHIISTNNQSKHLQRYEDLLNEPGVAFRHPGENGTKRRQKLSMPPRLHATRLYAKLKTAAIPRQS